MQRPTVLVTGAAGFIGAHVAARLHSLDCRVIGCDNFNEYYDPRLKAARVQALLTPVAIPVESVEIADAATVSDLFQHVRPDIVVHLAAQAGVRHSLSHPQAYVNSNLVGFANILESARNSKVRHLVYASSSSVYGERLTGNFKENDPSDSPVSLYAATKKANEVMAHAYSRLYGLRVTGLRFFTVYGPWGRPDMAYFSFAEKLLANHALPLYGAGMLQRDFTYIDDIAEGVARLTLSNSLPSAPAHEIFNIGNNRPVVVLEFVRVLGQLMGVNPVLQQLPLQPGDVQMTCADVDKLNARIGFSPSTELDEGLARFVDWFLLWKSTSSVSLIG